MEPSIWWCNQGESWKVERANNVVCSSSNTTRLTFRETVGLVKKGDICVHYRKMHIVALSQADEDGNPCEVPYPDYGNGWMFSTTYFDLKTPIHRDLINSDISALALKFSPIIKGGRVRYAYLIPFTVEGLRTIKAFTTEVWPKWAII